MLKNKFHLSLLVSFSVAAALSLLFSIGFLSAYNTGLSDNLYGGKAAFDDIVIVGIDDKSLQEIGRWPWDRDEHARLLEKIGNHARIVAFDIAFFEPSEEDDVFEDAITVSGNVVLVVEYINFSFRLEESKAFLGLQKPSVSARSGKLYGESLLRPVFSGNYAVGFANVFTDNDGVVRSSPVFIEGAENHKSFSNTIASLLGYNITETKLLINYAGRPKTFAHYSYSDVLNGRLNLSMLDGKIVLIGATAADLRDSYTTPVSSTQMAGVEIHANILQTILAGDFLFHQNALSVIFAIFILSLFAGFVLYKFRMKFATPIIFVAGIVYVFFAAVIFDGGIIMNILYPLLALSLGYIAHVAVFYVFESKQRRLVTNIFGKYVSSEVAAEILKHGTEDLALKGEKREITILFSDIRGFTSISEKFSPEELVQFLNTFLSAMTDAILEKRGIVDKYIGDAIMAFWGAPLKEERHAELACEAALGMKNKLQDIRPDLEIGIGINTGDAIVGNMGSAQRLNYTAIGDAVNTASRIEGLNKEYGTLVIIGESTYQQVKNIFVCRKLDFIRMKGKEKPLNIYELIGKNNDVDARMKKFVAHFHAGLEFYSRKKWPQAVAEFRDALKIKPDKASEVFIERCTSLRKTPPKNWDGVFTMKTK